MPCLQDLLGSTSSNFTLRFAGWRSLFPAVFTLLALAAVPASAATFHVTKADACDGPGTLRGALEQANDNPGPDTVVIDANLKRIDILACGPTITPGVKNELGNFSYLNSIDDVTIEGNGVTIAGSNIFFNSSGNRPSRCFNEKSDVMVANTPGLITVGYIGRGGSPVRTTIRNLKIDDLNHIAYVAAGSSLELEDFEATNLHQIRECGFPVLQVASEGGSVTLRRNRWVKINSWTLKLTDVDWLAAGGMIEGAGTLTIEDSTFLDSGGTKFGIGWFGQGKVDVVSSRFQGFGGIFVTGGVTTNFVNSVWLSGFDTKGAHKRFVQSSTGPMNFVNSTVLFPAETFFPGTCLFSDYLQYTSGQSAPPIGGITNTGDGAGPVNFRGSAIGATRTCGPRENAAPVLDDFYRFYRNTPGTFTADQYTFIGEITGLQGAAALRTLTGQPALLSDDNAPDALPGKEGGTAQGDLGLAVPAQGKALVDAIPDSCTAGGGSTTLLSPVFPYPTIAKDVTGNPRCESTLTGDRRNIGALQVTNAPHLESVLSPDGGNGQLDLKWTRPADRLNKAYTQYDVCYGTGALPDPTQPVCPPTATFILAFVQDPATLSGQLAGLVNGTEYWVMVRGNFLAVDPGPWSNLRTGIPYGPIASPAPLTAEPGDGEVMLTWTKPDLGGRLPGQFSGYSIVVSRVSTGEIVGARAIFDYNTLSVTITGLKNGTQYEFKVAANAGSVASEQAVARATPHGDVGQVNRTPTYRETATAKANQPRYWEAKGYGTCTKFEYSAGSVVELDSAASALILKSDTINDVWVPAPAGIMYGTASGKDISHVIMCVK